MPIPIAPYDPDNRFMKCAREHKLEALERSDSSSDSFSGSDNRFAQCALENRMRNRSMSCSVSASGSGSDSDLDNRFTQFAIQGKSEHRPRTYSQNTDYRTQTQTQSQPYSEHRSRTYSQNTDYRSQTQIHSPDNSPKLTKKDVEDFPSLCTKSPKPILMSPLRITTPIVSSPIATVLSVKDGKVIQKDIYEDVEPLSITPSKWPDVLKYTSGK